MRDGKIGLIAVGGRGERFRCSGRQKCLTEVGGYPVLDYAVNAFTACGVDIIVLLAGHHHRQVADYLEISTVEGANILLVYGGTVGEARAITCVEKVVGDYDFLYAGGDVVFPPERVEHLLATAYARADCIAVMSVSKDVAIAPTHSYVITDSAGIYVSDVALTESERHALSTSGLVSTGMYYFRSGALTYLSMVPDGQRMGLFLRFALEHGEKIAISDSDTPWFCLHTPDDLSRWPESDVAHFLDKR
jgi:NDP-sugar pyrophosphorylase family protein